MLGALAAGALLTLASSLPAAAARSGAGRAPAGCPALGRLTVAADATAEVYLSKAPPGQFNFNPQPQEIPNYMGCVVGHAPFVIGNWQDLGVKAPVLGGSEVAYTIPGEDAKVVHALNLVTRRTVNYRACDAASALGNRYGYTNGIVLNESGDVAWVCDAEAVVVPGQGAYREVHLADRTGTRTVASGTGIDLTSLALASHRVYWTQNGQAGSAPAT